MARVAIRGTVLVALYFVLIGQLAPDEIGLALGCGLCCLTWSLILRRLTRIRFHFGLANLGLALRALADLPRGIFGVSLALLWRRCGHIRSEGLRDDAASNTDATWRAIKLLAVSLSPDHYALRWGRSADTIELHLLSARMSEAR